MFASCFDERAQLLEGSREARLVSEAFEPHLRVHPVVGLLAIDLCRQAGKLLAIADGQRRYAYPVWQVRGGETLPGLAAVLGEITNMSALDKAHFMTSPDARLDGQMPLAVLRRGDIARVRAAARAYGTQGAA